MNLKPETRNLNPFTVVTGLPRSGTSMMMKMLEAGGVPPLCDGERTADSDNPNGYYEFEPVKNTKNDPSWLRDAPGKAVKMVYSLLYDLPETFLSHRRQTVKQTETLRPKIPRSGERGYEEESATHYNIIFMRRDLSEILASQQQMLSNMNIQTTVDDDRMAKLFTGEIVRFQKWIAQATHINCIEVLYNDVASGSVEPLHQINLHLGGGLNVDAMSAVVDPKLYRNRAA